MARNCWKEFAWWEEYAQRNSASIDNNPSWGNKQGGLTTIIEKSLARWRRVARLH
ncbi:MAG UNVERIFIED_CONTAM: UxaA family hydrolase [Planctomycetaceae bacterium]